MKEKNDLMGNIANDDGNLKRYLIIGGLIFVIFVIGIVVAKFAFGTPKNNTQVILPPEPTTKAQKEDTNLFNSIPIEQNNNQKTQQPIKKEEKVEEIKNTQNEFKKPQPEKIETPTKSTTPPKIEEISKAKETPTIETINIKPKQVVKQEATPKKTKITKSPKIARHYYIQVAAVTRGEVSKSFLKLIKQNGFNYKIMVIDVKGKKIKRVLVGPFSKDEAKKALPKVRKEIMAQAFIKRVKWNIKNL